MREVVRARSLSFEWIGYSRRNDYWWMPKRERPYRRPWVAHITGTDTRRGLVREFVDEEFSEAWEVENAR